MTNTMMHDIRLLPISQIKIGDRHRKDMGDLRDLAASIESGLLQPIGVTPEMELSHIRKVMHEAKGDAMRGKSSASDADRRGSGPTRG